MKQDLIDISIFDFNDYKAFLTKKGLPQGFYTHSSKNLNTWAKRLGYKSSSSLSMVLNGERLPSEEMIDKFAADLKMSSREKRYFELLIELEKRKKKNQDISDVLEKIKKSCTEKNSFAIDLTRFSTISEWYYVAIKQLISTKDFVEDENWIYKRLRKKVTLGQIKIALKNLEELEIIKRDENGKFKVIKPGLITSNDVPSSAIRKHHHGMMELAMQALLEQNIDQRQINSTSLKINKTDLPEAKKFIFDFIKEFASRFHIDDSSNIYQLNVQLFELSKEIPSSTMEQ